MTFRCDGCTYETGAMRQFLTGDPAVPVILITPDYRRVFVMRQNGSGPSHVDHANTLQIISLASRYQIKELLNAFPARHVDHVELETTDG